MYHVPGGMHVRVDSALYQGYTVPPYYDSMIGKLIVYGRTREGCLMRLKRALEEFVIEGMKTTIPPAPEADRRPRRPEWRLFDQMAGGLAGAAEGVRPLATVLLLGAVAAAPASPVTELAGRYSWHFRNGMVDGSSYWSDDVVEIVPVDASHAYVRFALEFHNGHSCSLDGVAQTAGEALVYHGLPDDTFGNGKPCRLTIRRQGAKLAYDDDGTCKAHCGARGSLRGDLAWSSKRPITYMARLKASRQYRDALAEWHAGKSVQP